MIHTYEDRALSRQGALPPGRVRHPGPLFGRSEAFVDVVVIRDPLNFFASRLRQWHRLSGRKDPQVVVDLWKQHAREALGMTSCLTSGRVVANFTRWAAEAEYRRELARALGVDFSDAGRDTIMPGFSSSFEGGKYRSKATQMRVNERWRAYASSDELAAILDDKEIRELSDALFGHLEGWDCLQHQ